MYKERFLIFLIYLFCVNMFRVARRTAFSIAKRSVNSLIQTIGAYASVKLYHKNSNEEDTMYRIVCQLQLAECTSKLKVIKE